MSKITRICFVCLGNIVRSPLAENMFRHLADQVGAAHKYELDSAGTSGWHIDDPPDRRMRHVAAHHGFEYDGRARQFEHRDFENFNLIIAMDATNQSDLLLMASTSEHKAKVRLMREFDPHSSPTAPVPDPYYGGIDGFEDVFAIVKRSCQGLLTALEDGTVIS